jgi:hypothetical protein
MGAGKSKDKDVVYDISINSLDPAKKDPIIGRFQDYEKGEQFNMGAAAATATAIANKNIIIIIILLLLLMLCKLLFYKVKKK